MQPIGAAASTPPNAALLTQAEDLRTSDHPQFLRLLETLQQQASSMSPHERWQLRYLQGWQAAFRGDYAGAEGILREVIGHSGDPPLVAKASAVLMNAMASNRHYEEAFELANRLMADLPKIEDTQARFLVRLYVAQVLSYAEQYDLAANYFRDMLQALPPGETSCKPEAMLISVLYQSHKLNSASIELPRGIEACRAAGQPIFADTIWLVKASLYLDEDQPDRAIALLRQIAPRILASQNYYHTQNVQEEFAQAYWKLGDDDKARKAALAVLAVSDPGDINGTLKDAYEILYRIEKKHGRAMAALTYYEHYAAQNIGHLNDISAKTLAYDVAQQRMLAQKLETEKLSRQNKLLQLQQALAAKTIETGHLYIALLLLVLASVIFWLLRTKRSQLHFKQQARLDGLTGIFNHQHFIGEAQRALQLLERRRGDACLVFIDLDYFKQINDTHGHAVGDALLKHTVAICKQPMRANDLFGRLGGEEFGILLLGCSHEQGMVIADRVRTAIETTPMNVDGCAITFSASIGLVSTQACGYGLQLLCREADAALYRAKRSGRNRLVSHVEHNDPVKLFQVGHGGP
ncbi:tetratricopeptide repeat-containing diguanylate cyclase [Dyella flagellata]|nr:GGDEF domain-containing protein [Dyella flagellata]